MKVEVLVSTMNRANKEEVCKLVNKMKIKGKATVVNQVTDVDIEKTVNQDEKLKIYSYNDKGLSKSRNILLNKLESDIGIIADDDVTYNENYQEIIEEAYKEYPEADIIAFNIKSGNKNRPIRKQKTHKVNLFTAMRIQSNQITFKRGINIKFDEEFGAGSKYNFGEENIWLYDCIKNGKRIYYINKEMGQALQQESTWYAEKDEKFLKCEGAVFYRISKNFYWILNLQYAIRKRKEYRKNINIIKAIKYLFQGAREYRNSKNI